MNEAEAKQQQQHKEKLKKALPENNFLFQK